jgi:hypothetical protein
MRPPCDRRTVAAQSLLGRYIPLGDISPFDSIPLSAVGVDSVIILEQREPRESAIMLDLLMRNRRLNTCS